MFLPEACLFDLDGLLLDTEELHGEAWGKTVLTVKRTINKNQLMNLRGRQRKDCAKKIKEWLHLQIEPVRPSP